MLFLYLDQESLRPNATQYPSRVKACSFSLYTLVESEEAAQRPCDKLIQRNANEGIEYGSNPRFEKDTQNFYPQSRLISHTVLDILSHPVLNLINISGIFLRVVG